MKALRNPVPLATLLVLQACSSQSPPSGTAAPTLLPASLDKPETIQPQTFMLRGKVVIGHESQYIMSCGSDKQYTGVSYPLNPSMAPKTTPEQVSGVRLFSDGIRPVQEGVRL